MPPLPAGVFMEIYSAVIGDDILHFVTLPDGSTDEDWGLRGIRRLLKEHLESGAAEMHADFALAFFRDMHSLMEDEYTVRVDIIHDSDVVNIRITRPGEPDAHYGHRFDMYEAGGWWVV